MMVQSSADASKSRFAAYVEGLVGVIGHADRAGPLRDYCLGLIMPCERKSVEPMAAVTAPDRTAAKHQSPLHFVGQSPWSNERVLAKVGEMVLPSIERHGPIEAWIIDDTGFPKKGQHSVGVARQYCGELGKQDNCQVAVSLSLANHHASLPVAWRLYLPKEWAVDHERRRKVGVPDEIDFKTKPEIALEQIETALKAGLSRGVVLMDAGYGCNTNLRSGISSARQVLLSMRSDQIHFPRPSDGKRMVAFDWTPIRYRTVISVLKNPFYSGVYVYGKTEKRTAIVEGRPQKTYGHSKPFGEWEVKLKDHHEGYIDWAEFEWNQKQLAANAYGRMGGAKSGRGGPALLAGLLTCGRCGRRLTVSYSGRTPGQRVYRCDRPNLMLGHARHTLTTRGGAGSTPPNFAGIKG